MKNNQPLESLNQTNKFKFEQGSFWVNETDNSGQTLLHYAVRFKRDDIIDSLLYKGANPNLPNIQSKKPMDYADDNIKRKHPDLTKVNQPQGHSGPRV
ncbi:ankyrin repeat domain-containing protein [Legionella gresilensis]|uniref:ankyrin repeat domain-containing protein n=1 Tax=Legionella gresilensis TaxID=91823 RepID=UPI0010415B63|nr:ankyrin repeat domain-containing protein [Legionella gresilensis]